MKKKIIGLFLCVLVVASLAGSVAARASEGNGYVSNSIYYNDKVYDYWMSTRFDAAKGASIQLTCQAPITVTLYNLEVKYNTKNYGYIINTGGAQTKTLDPANGDDMICTKDVPCSKGMSQVIDYTYIQGSGKITSRNYGVPLTYYPNVRAW